MFLKAMHQRSQTLILCSLETSHLRYLTLNYNNTSRPIFRQQHPPRYAATKQACCHRLGQNVPFTLEQYSEDRLQNHVIHRALWSQWFWAHCRRPCSQTPRPLYFASCRMTGKAWSTILSCQASYTCDLRTLDLFIKYWYQLSNICHKYDLVSKRTEVQDVCQTLECHSTLLHLIPQRCQETST